MATLSSRRILDAWDALTSRLRAAGEVIPRLVMRIVMGWEFWESGLEKYRGENWFADIRGDFPLPFNLLPADFSWTIATWFELIGAIALWLGLGTRFFAFSLLFLTFVATAAVHFPDMLSMWTDLLKGYSVSDKGYGNFKLPLLFSVMLLPLIFNGPGKLSLDHLIAKWLRLDTSIHPLSDAYAWALAAAILGLPFLMLLPWVGTALLGTAVVLAAFGRFARA